MAKINQKLQTYLYFLLEDWLRWSHVLLQILTISFKATEVHITNILTEVFYYFIIKPAAEELFLSSITCITTPWLAILGLLITLLWSQLISLDNHVFPHINPLQLNYKSGCPQNRLQKLHQEQMWSSHQLPYLISPILKQAAWDSLHFQLAKLPIKLKLVILTTPAVNERGHTCRG